MITNIIRIIFLAIIGCIEISYFMHPQQRVIRTNESLAKFRAKNFVSKSTTASRGFSVNACEFVMTFLLFFVGGAPQAIMILCQSIIVACIELSMDKINENIIRLDALITILICLTGFSI